MSSTFRWGILGTGWIAEMFVTDLRATGIEVTAVGSRSQESADAFGSRFGIPPRHASYEALVADPEVDAVYVATPHPMHAANALLAIAAGKHVLVEKPFTLNAAEAAEVAAAADAPESSCSRRCGPGSCRRWCASARSSPRAPSARCARSSPTTTSSCPPTRSTASTTPIWAAAPCSTWASTRSRSRSTSSVRRPRSRRTATRPRRASTGRSR